MKLNDLAKLHNAILDGVYLGQKMPIIMSFKGSECLCEDIITTSEKAINEVAKCVGNEITSYSTNYREATFLRNREFEGFEKIVNQDIDDYNINMNLLNALTLAKTMATLAAKEENKDIVYFLCCDLEDDYLTYEVFNNQEELDEYYRENFEE